MTTTHELPYGSTDVERLVNATVRLVEGRNFGTGGSSACSVILEGMFMGEAEESVPAGVVAGLGDWHAAPGHGGSANRHTDVRGSKPQVGYSQEGAPD
jgi:hypothetical protein